MALTSENFPNEAIQYGLDRRKCARSGQRAKLADREQATIRVSDSHSDFFTRNMIAVLAEARAALGIDDSVADMTPPALMKAIMQAPVDLWFNGGIGTYIKARSETHGDVGDKTNDALRVDALKLAECLIEEGRRYAKNARA